MAMHVVIAGAGISGLSAAISLRRSGHRVTIFERSSLSNEVGAAINVPPNVGRFLLPWGLDPDKYGFVASNGVYFISPTTLEEFATHDHSHNVELYGKSLYHAHRVDLHESLKDIAIDPDGPGIPAIIHMKSAVTSYDPHIPAITLQDGTVITADLVIAADGVNSTAAEVVLGKANPPEVAKHVNCCYRFLIPSTDLEDDPETSWITQGYQKLGCRVYPDHEVRRRLIAYTCRNHEIHNFVAICYNDDMSSKKEDWHASVDKVEVLEKYAGFHPDILAVINKAKDVKKWPLLYRPPLQSWHKGNMALIGDAAHPMLPHHAQGGAQGIEDGLALGLVMHGITEPSQVEARLAIYEKIRLNRTAVIQIMSNFGLGEPVPDDIVQFLEGRPAPKNMNEMIKLAYGEDVLQRTIKHMTDFDSSWKLPDGFFPVVEGQNTTIKQE